MVAEMKIILCCLHTVLYLNFGYTVTASSDLELSALEQKLSKQFQERLHQLEIEFQRTTNGLEQHLEATNDELLVTKKRLAEAEKRIENVAAQEKPDASSLLAKRIVPQPSGHVAFSAHLSTGAKELGLHHIIPFDTVYANEGNAFDPLLHVFTCPESGVYIFMTAVLAELHQNTVTEIAKNGVPLVQAYSAGSTTSHGYDQGFNSVITSCAAGDRVWVQIHAHQGTSVFDAGFSTFSGYRLF